MLMVRYRVELPVECIVYPIRASVIHDGHGTYVRQCQHDNGISDMV